MRELAEETSSETVFSVDPTNGSDLYNISKLMGEALMFNTQRANLRVARLSNVIGPDDVSSGNFLADVCRQALQGRISLRTSLSSAKDYIHVDDAATLLRLIATAGRRNCYNVASGVALSHRQIVDRLRELTGCLIEVDSDAPEVEFPPVITTAIDSEFGVRRRSVLELAA